MIANEHIVVSSKAPLFTPKFDSHEDLSNKGS